jgi:hypothetical protein
MIFSGPIQPPMLGAAIASARIHLSPEIVQLQKELQERISLCNRLLKEYICWQFRQVGYILH